MTKTEIIQALENECSALREKYQSLQAVGTEIRFNTAQAMKYISNNFGVRCKSKSTFRRFWCGTDYQNEPTEILFNRYRDIKTAKNENYFLKSEIDAAFSDSNLRSASY